jgi:hypothetical protein
MRDYVAAEPITVENPSAVIQAVACVDKDENPYRQPRIQQGNMHDPDAQPAVGGDE